MKNKKYWLLTSLVTLLPILAGLLLWNSLPDKLPTHFGADGTADGWSGKAFAVFGIPVLMLLFHWIIYLTTRLDKQNRGHNEKVLNLIGLLFPAMSVVFGVLIYNTALGLEINMARILFPLLGLFFVLVGNWLPKVRQNSTLGIKLPWTLYSEENWNKTHRFAGFIWVLCGLGFLAVAFLPAVNLLWMLPVLLIAMAGAPMVYSWRLAKRQQKAGTYTESQVNKNLKKHPVIQVISLILVILILAGTAFLMFTGDITYTCTGDSLVIEADYWDDLTVQLDTIDSIELRQGVDGIREWGYGSAKLLLGWFTNEEFGGYTRYTYTDSESCIVLHAGEDVLVIADKTPEATQALYEQLLLVISE